MQQCDQRAPDRKAGDEGLGAVDRVEHPDIFGVLAFAAELLADDAVLGKVGLDQAAHHGFGGAVGLGDRVEIAGTLVVDGKRGAEKRQDGFAGGGRQAADEGCEIDDRHGCSLEDEVRMKEEFLTGILGPCLAQSGKPRTVVTAFASGILNAESELGFGEFSVYSNDHEVESFGIPELQHRQIYTMC